MINMKFNSFKKLFFIRPKQVCYKGIYKRLINLSLVFYAFICLAGVRSCCNSDTTAVMPGQGRDYKWVKRNTALLLPLQRDASTLVDEEIFTLQPPFQDYSYKFGLQAVTD